MGCELLLILLKQVCDILSKIFQFENTWKLIFAAVLDKISPESYWESFIKHFWKFGCFKSEQVKGTLSGLRQFLVTESPLKMMKNAFYFTSKALFLLKIFKLLSWLFGQVAKQLYRKDKVYFKFYDVTAWLTNSLNWYRYCPIFRKVKAIRQWNFVS